MKKPLIVMLTIFITFCACMQKDSTNEIKKLIGDNTYTAIVAIEIHGNKADSKYKVKQYYKYPDKLRIETIEPEFLKEKVIIKNGDDWRIIHPLMKQRITATKLMSENEMILIGAIEKNYFKDYEKNATVEEYKNEKFICIRKPIAMSNVYRNTAVLYLEKESMKPRYLNILDNYGNLKIEIKYEDYNRNSIINEELFNLN